MLSFITDFFPNSQNMQASNRAGLSRTQPTKRIYHQGRPLQRLRLAQICGSIQCSAVVPSLIQRGIAVI